MRFARTLTYNELANIKTIKLVIRENERSLDLTTLEEYFTNALNDSKDYSLT